MKSLFKVSLLAATLAVGLNAPLTMAAETTAQPSGQVALNSAFKD